DRTPFYAEGGGQLADAGTVRTTTGAVVDVVDVQSPVAGLVVHRGLVTSGEVVLGDTVRAEVDVERRRSISRAHTATHMVHKAIREALGETATQAGSENAPGRFRFDFSASGAVPPSVLRDVEQRVNTLLADDLEVTAEVMTQEQARAAGAMALFGEKYGDAVRVVSVGDWAKELCGGTHVGRTGDIGLFKIVAESGVAAGVRRVEAVTGDNALAYVQELEALSAAMSGYLKASRGEHLSRVAQVLDQVRTLEKEVAALKGKLASSQGDELMSQAVDIKGLKVLAAKLEGADARTLRETMDKLKDKLKTAVIVLAAVDGDKVQIAAGVTADSVGKVKAGELVNFVAQQVGGKGGGKADMAMAGGTDASRLPAALQSVQAWVAERA
ncbi:MAG: DHHA1 domain-containing protein, partial [Pseudomonadota bacterium]|nr:DHHA1 domain-containing protein [Pseudomonadota bacterium]